MVRSGGRAKVRTCLAGDSAAGKIAPASEGSLITSSTARAGQCQTSNMSVRAGSSGGYWKGCGSELLLAWEDGRPILADEIGLLQKV